MSYPYEGYYPTMRDCERYADDLSAMYHTLLEEAKERLRAEKAREAERRPVTLNVTINTIAPGKPDPEALRNAFSEALEDAGVGSTWLTEDEELDCAGHPSCAPSTSTPRRSPTSSSATSWHSSSTVP